MNEGEDLDELLTAARELDPQAWAARDRLYRDCGVNPDRMDRVPRNAVERRMQDRRMRSLAVALDRHVDPEGVLSRRQLSRFGE
jgi:hypothetical protein